MRKLSSVYGKAVKKFERDLLRLTFFLRRKGLLLLIFGSLVKFAVPHEIDQID